MFGIFLKQKVACKVNEAVRESEYARRLPILEKHLVVESLRPWIGRPTFNTQLSAVPNRKLLMEGPLKFIRSQFNFSCKLYKAFYDIFQFVIVSYLPLM